MKRASEESEAEPKPKRARREPLLFDLLPKEVITGEIFSKLEPPWRYLLNQTLFGRGNREEVKPEAIEVVKYGLPITKYMVENKLINVSMISRAACYHGDRETYRYGITLKSNARFNISHCEYAIMGNQIEMFKELLPRVPQGEIGRLFQKVFEEDHPEFLEIVYQFTGYHPWHLTSVCNYASIKCLDYLHQRFGEVPTSEILSGSLSSAIGAERVRSFWNETGDRMGVVPNQTAYTNNRQPAIFRILYDFGLIPSQEQISKTYYEPQFTSWLIDTFHLEVETRTALLSSVVTSRNPDFALIKRLRDLGTPWTVYGGCFEILPDLVQMGYPYAQQSVDIAGKFYNKNAYPILKKLNCTIPEVYRVQLLRDFNQIPQAETYLEMMHYTYEYLAIPLSVNNTECLIALSNFLRPTDINKNAANFILASVFASLKTDISLTGVDWIDEHIRIFNRRLALIRTKMRIADHNARDPTLKSMRVWRERASTIYYTLNSSTIFLKEI